MQFLKQGVKPEDVEYTVDDYVKKIQELEDETLRCKRVAFDMTVREVIDSGLIYKKCNHKHIEKNNGKGDFDSYGRLVGFAGECQQCFQGVNKHDCSIEGETYYMTCNEARIVNMTAANYGLKGSIHTATQFRD